MPTMSKHLLLVAVLGGAAVAPLPLIAQRPTGRPGMWLGAGAGLGWARVSCRICGTNRGHGPSGYAHAGGRLSNRVLVGGEVEGWFRNGNQQAGAPSDELLLAYSAVLYWFPSSRYSYYLKGGLGLVTYRIADGTNRVTSSAFGPTIGAGWELPIATHLALVPYFNVLAASIGADLKSNGATVLEGSSLALIQFGVGLSRR